MITGLTPRESEVVKLIAQAKSNKLIAFELSLTEKTTKEYVHRIMRKLNMHSRTEIAVWVVRSLGIVLLVSAAMAQTAITLNGPATARAGQTVTLTLSAAGATNSGAAALQWALSLPPGYAATVTAGTADPDKTATCTATGSVCVLWALDATIMGNGPIASIALKIPATVTPGPVSLALSGLVASDATGSNLPLAPPAAPLSLTILDRRDINGDGTVNAADVSLMLNEVIASQSNPAACVDDQTGDGQCNVIDVMVVVLKVLGLVQ